MPSLSITNHKRLLRLTATELARRSKELRELAKKCGATFLALASALSLPAWSANDYTVVIDRAARNLLVKDASGKTLVDAKVGIGRGGLGKKRRMADCITPSGNFQVDIVLYKPPYDAVADKLKKQYSADKNAIAYLGSSTGLQKLLSNMNSIDFNVDGKPDTAYGAAYLGLDSRDAICGPKFSKFKNTDYWFSIAIHGTPNEARNLGAAYSGGCIQLPEKILKQLIEQKILALGSQVVIK